MSRPIVDYETVDLDDLSKAPFPGAVRLVFVNPRRGGPTISALRTALASKGTIRFSATSARTFVDVDPGPPNLPLVALDTIVRDDMAGLERMLLTVLPHVDEIVIGVDGRSNPETLKIAQAYADCVYVFEAADIGVSEEAWTANNKIDFSAARNLGRSRVHAPWTLVIDSDEYLGAATDFRKLAAEADAATPLAGFARVGSYGVDVQLGTTFRMKKDLQRFARTEYRWTEAIHNQLLFDAPVKEAAGALIVSDLNLRTLEEQDRRHTQRDAGINELYDEAVKGNLTALFHFVKHKAARGNIQQAVELAEDYRLRIEPHSVLSTERVWIALGVAFRYYNDDNLPEAERWAVRALLDGPHTTAFCLLGDIAEEQGDLERAKGWYECACAMTEKNRLDWPGVTELRFGRLAGIRKAIIDPANATVAVIEQGS